MPLRADGLIAVPGGQAAPGMAPPTGPPARGSPAPWQPAAPARGRGPAAAATWPCPCLHSAPRGGWGGVGGGGQKSYAVDSSVPACARQRSRHVPMAGVALPRSGLQAGRWESWRCVAHDGRLVCTALCLIVRSQRAGEQITQLRPPQLAGDLAVDVDGIQHVQLAQCILQGLGLRARQAGQQGCSGQAGLSSGGVGARSTRSCNIPHKLRAAGTSLQARLQVHAQGAHGPRHSLRGPSPRATPGELTAGASR